MLYINIVVIFVTNISDLAKRFKGPFVKTIHILMKMIYNVEFVYNISITHFYAKTALKKG